MISVSESVWVSKTSFAFLSVLQLMIRIGSRMGLGAPILLTDRSENEKRSRLGGSSFGMGRGWAVGGSVFWELDFLGAIVEAGGFPPYHRGGLIPWGLWVFIASQGFFF